MYILCLLRWMFTYVTCSPNTSHTYRKCHRNVFDLWCWFLSSEKSAGRLWHAEGEGGRGVFYRVYLCTVHVNFTPITKYQGRNGKFYQEWSLVPDELFLFQKTAFSLFFFIPWISFMTLVYFHSGLSLLWPPSFISLIEHGDLKAMIMYPGGWIRKWNYLLWTWCIETSGNL